MTITFSTNRGVICYRALQRPGQDEPAGIASGLLGGEPALVAIVGEILAGRLPKRVRVAEPDLDYVFSENRDTVADVAAAMLVAGNGRGRLCDSGWDALDAVMEDVVHEMGHRVENRNSETPVVTEALCKRAHWREKR